MGMNSSSDLSPLAAMYFRLSALVDIGISEARLDEAIREEWAALAAQAEEEVGHLLPRAKDPRVWTLSSN